MKCEGTGKFIFISCACVLTIVCCLHCVIFVMRKTGTDYFQEDKAVILSSLMTKQNSHPDVLDLVTKYAQKFRSREQQQNSEYELAEKEFEQRNQQYIESVAAYQRRKAAILKQQALRLEQARNVRKLRRRPISKQHM
jgi:pyruvate/2-oxoacid:ferredoxin oxidoreductase beta subunit